MILINKQIVILTSSSGDKVYYEVARIGAETAFLEKRKGPPGFPARYQKPVNLDPEKHFPQYTKVEIQEPKTVV